MDCYVGVLHIPSVFLPWIVPLVSRALSVFSSIGLLRSQFFFFVMDCYVSVSCILSFFLVMDCYVSVSRILSVFFLWIVPLVSRALSVFSSIGLLR